MSGKVTGRHSPSVGTREMSGRVTGDGASPPRYHTPVETCFLFFPDPARFSAVLGGPLQ